MAFEGLPSPAAAGVLVSFVLFHQEMIPQQTLPLWILPMLTIGVGMLMVSRIPYSHVVNHYLKGKKPFGYLIKVLFFIGVVFFSSPQTALMLIFLSFAASGLIRSVHQHLRSKQPLPLTADGDTQSALDTPIT